MTEPRIYLTSLWQQHPCSRMYIPAIKSLHYSDNMHRVNPTRARIRKYRNKYVLFYIKGARVQRETPASKWNFKLFRRENCSHESADGEGDDLDADWGDAQLLLAVTEEFVDKGEEDAGGDAEEPCSEGEDGEGGVVGGGDRQANFFDGMIILFLWYRRKIVNSTNIKG